MSALISSAVGGKKAAAPKGGARRRPPAAATKDATPISISSAQTSVAPPSPPPTHLPDTSELSLATPAATAPSSNEPRAPSQPVEDASRQPTPISLPTQFTPVESQVRTPTPAQTDVANTEATPVESDVQSTQAESVPAGPSTSKKRRRDPPASKETTQAAKRVKRSSARGNAGVQAAVQDEETSVAPTRTTRKTAQSKRQTASATDTAVNEVSNTAPANAKAKRRPSRKSASTVVDSDAEEDTTQSNEEQQATQQPAARPKRRPQKKKKGVAQQARTGEDANTGEDGDEAEGQGDEEDDEDGDSSDPELHEIDPSTKTMYEIGHDKRHGKRSGLDKDMDKIDWVEVARKNYDAEVARAAAAAAAVAAAAAGITTTTATSTNAALPTNNVIETTENPDGTAEPRTTNQQPSAPETQNQPTADTGTGGVQFRIVNGQIVEDETTLTIDRQGRAEAEANLTSEPITEETDLTRRINRTTYLNDRRRCPTDRGPMWRMKSEPWNDAETERFYDALRMFGTDFTIIAAMFPGKTRRHLKNKFVREEKFDEGRVKAALMGKETRKMDLEFYARETGRDVADFRKFEGLEHVEEVIAADTAVRKGEMLAYIAKEEANEREAREAAGANQGPKKKGREKKAKDAGAGAGAGGGGRGGRKKGRGGAAAAPVGGMGGGGPAEAVEVADG